MNSTYAKSIANALVLIAYLLFSYLEDHNLSEEELGASGALLASLLLVYEVSNRPYHKNRK